jgi:hypothetical protein
MTLLVQDLGMSGSLTIPFIALVTLLAIACAVLVARTRRRGQSSLSPSRLEPLSRGWLAEQRRNGDTSGGWYST